MNTHQDKQNLNCGRLPIYSHRAAFPARIAHRFSTAERDPTVLTTRFLPFDLDVTRHVVARKPANTYRPIDRLRFLATKPGRRCGLATGFSQYFLLWTLYKSSNIACVLHHRYGSIRPENRIFRVNARWHGDSWRFRGVPQRMNRSPDSTAVSS